MNPKVLMTMYSSAFAGAVVLSVAYDLWLNKQHKKDSTKPPCLSDTENGERRIEPKFIKVYGGQERS